MAYNPCNSFLVEIQFSRDASSKELGILEFFKKGPPWEHFELN